MIVRMLQVLMAGLILMFAVGAQAQSAAPKPWYVGVGAGGAWYSDQDFDGGPTLSMKTGLTANGSFGRYLDDIRVVHVEVESLYDRADVSSLNGASADGTVSNVGLMFNLLYDIQTGTSWVPFLGAGIGYSWVDFDGVKQGGVTALSDSDSSFSYQFKGGVAYQFDPSMAVTLLYRYYATDNLSLRSPTGASVKTDGTRIQNVELGFRFNF
jgi:opacity protein-like surface antigen